MKKMFLRIEIYMMMALLKYKMHRFEAQKKKLNIAP